jgi:uncharacterized protein YPO0396
MGFASKKPPGSVPDAAAKAKRLSAMPVRAALEVSPPFSHNQSMNPSVTREELDAKLAANVAEVKSVAYEMSVDVSGLRAEFQIQCAVQNEKMGELRADLNGKMSELRADLNGKMSELRADLNEQMSELRTDLNERLSGIQAFMEKQAAKADAEAAKTAARFASMDTKFDCIETRIDSVEKSLDHKIDSVEKSLEHKIDVLQRVISLVATLAGVWIGYLQLR